MPFFAATGDLAGAAALGEEFLAKGTGPQDGPVVGGLPPELPRSSGADSAAAASSGADAGASGQEETPEGWSALLAAYQRILKRWESQRKGGAAASGAGSTEEEAGAPQQDFVMADGSFAPSLPDLAAAAPLVYLPYGLDTRAAHNAYFGLSATGAGEASVPAVGDAGEAFLPEFWGRMQCVLYYEVGRCCPNSIKKEVCAEVKELILRMTKAQLRDRAKIQRESRKGKILDPSKFESAKDNALVAVASYFFLFGNREDMNIASAAMGKAAQQDGPWFQGWQKDQPTPIIERLEQALEDSERMQFGILERVKCVIMDRVDEKRGDGEAEFDWSPADVKTGEAIPVEPSAPEAERLELCTRVVKAVHPDFGIKRVHRYILRLHPTWALSEKRLKSVMQKAGLVQG